MARGNLSLGILTRSHINWAAQIWKIARGLKFWIEEVEGYCYLCSENKDADQMRNYCAVDLHLCFCIYAKSRL